MLGTSRLGGRGRVANSIFPHIERGNELLQPPHQFVHRVGEREIQREENTLIVVGCQDQVALAVDAKTGLLRLVASDDHAGVDLLQELIDARGSDAAAPDQLIDRPGAAFVIGAGQRTIENRKIEIGDLRSRSAGCGRKTARWEPGSPAAATAEIR